jgi:hypothetical protein
LLPRQIGAPLRGGGLAMLEHLVAGYGVGVVCRHDGSVGLRVNGLEFAQIHEGRFRTAKAARHVAGRNSRDGCRTGSAAVC